MLNNEEPGGTVVCMLEISVVGSPEVSSSDVENIVLSSGVVESSSDLLVVTVSCVSGDTDVGFSVV